MNIVVWNENRHEQKNPVVAEIYPEGIHGAIADFLQQDANQVKTATLDEPEHGLTEEVLNATDVLVWWGHLAHDEVQDEIVERVKKRVLEGMGLIVLHSAHFSKIFKTLMGTTCDLNGVKQMKKNVYGLLIRVIRLQQVLGNISNLKKKKCTASILISQHLMS